MCEKYYKKKTISKHKERKHRHILVPSQRYQHSKHLLQDPTVPNYAIGFSNRAKIFTGPKYLNVDCPCTIRKKYCC